MNKIYLQQFLSQAGVASRRSATDAIKQGRVKVNGRTAELGLKIDPRKDKIKIGKRLIKMEAKKIYYLVNKPIGYTSTTKDKHAKKLVTQLVPQIPKVWPVGRLDKNSHGLIILTNDGELTNRLTHPKFNHQKEYLVTLNKPIAKELLLKLDRGIKLKEGLAKADKLKKISSLKLSITIHQGWNRQIRRMLDKCGYKVADLQRIRIGEYKLGNLKTGKYKRIS